ncbi:sulfurtransferase TusA family protein [Acidianus brierleyi]|uniref:Preprotein translocase subunit TatB n=1 Tax=Acidianus brierleyi TaxID=41673 RepID=A0A2U9IIL4_9CREN|nr:sulfurtransferase TusA family protein [Acidianus brierleyi]AWR95784.1 preprotein translocase subunit TatB [Acidianus brierleyi]
MLAKLKIESFEPLLNLEKFGRIYLLKDVKKLDYGYLAKLRWVKNDFEVLIRVKSNTMEIIDENGKFSILICFENRNAEVTLKCSSIHKMLFTPLAWKIVKNLESYSEYISKISLKTSTYSNSSILELFRTKPTVTLDLRGVTCPIPEIESKKAILQAKPFDAIEVLVDHPAAILYTLPEVAKSFNCRYEIINRGDYASFVFIIGRKEHEENLNLNEINNIIRDEREIAKLYIYFDKIIKELKIEKFSPDMLYGEGLTLIVASPEGRGWLLTALVENEKLISARLDLGNTKLYDYDAVNVITDFNGLMNVYYLKH